MLSAVRGDSGKEVSSSALSVLINPKDPHTVQLGQLGDENGEQGNGVDHKMDPIVFGVEAGENIQDDGGDGEELARGRELDAVVHLLPVREEPGLALIRRLEGRPLHRVEQEVHAQVVDEVGEGPDDGHAGERDAEQDDVQEADAQDVGQPHPPAVHHTGVGVHLAVRRAHVHDGGGGGEAVARRRRGALLQRGKKWLQLRPVLAPVRYHRLFVLSVPSVMQSL